MSQIAKASDAIRRKHKMLKMGQEASDKYTNDVFKPIVTPLEKLINQTNISDIKKDIKDEAQVNPVKDEEYDDSEETLQNFDDTFIKKSLFDQSILTSSPIPTKQNLTFSPLSTEKYMKRLDHQKNQTGYQVRKNKNNELLFGDQKINFSDKQISVGNNTYIETPGLLELLFNKNINESLVTVGDEENFINIIKSTNAHHKFFKPEEAFREEKSHKYEKYILPFINSLTKTGESLPNYKMTNKSKFDYVYWNDPNELVDRLRLLLASQSAGNPSHTNEIISIIEELKEAGIIY